MPASIRGKHALPPYAARHARRSQVPGRVAAVTAVGGLLIPIAATTAADADGRQASSVRVSGLGHAVQPGSAPVSIRLLSDDHYVANGLVELQIPEGSGWRTVKKPATNADGLASTTLAVSRDTRVRAFYRGSAQRTAATSSSVVIDVEAWGQRILAEAARHRGAPYRYGATGPSAFDCSGFTRYVFGRLGRSLPHNAREQRGMSQAVSRSAARIGDLVFLDGDGHVGIYAGNGSMWDAPRSGKSVSLRRIYSTSYTVGRVAAA